ncbi:MAG: hypothetical protein ACOZBL_04075 [Patescibacteria group bacterium]
MISYFEEISSALLRICSQVFGAINLILILPFAIQGIVFHTVQPFKTVSSTVLCRCSSSSEF